MFRKIWSYFSVFISNWFKLSVKRRVIFLLDYNTVKFTNRNKKQTNRDDNKNKAKIGY